MAALDTTMTLLEDSYTPAAIYVAYGANDGDTIRCDDKFTNVTLAVAVSQSLQQAVGCTINFPEILFTNASLANDIVVTLVYGVSRRP